MDSVTLKLDEVFPTLSREPVTEAVLELRCRAETDWEEERVSAWLGNQVTNLPKIESLRGLMTEMRFEPGSAAMHRAEDLGWLGLVMRSENGNKVVRFQRDTFAFSQLSPYPGWNAFIKQAVELWMIHERLAKPAEIARIGLRFINRIDLTGENIMLDDYLVSPPKEPDGLNLPFAGFLHSDTLAVPGHEYSVQITRTIQPPQDKGPQKLGLIIDIDVFSTRPWVGKSDELESRLLEMRWLKNKAFFGSLTSTAKTLLK